MANIRKIGVLTGGGDAPGLNAVIRAVVKSALNNGIDCYGIPNSYDGLLEADRPFPLTRDSVTGILRMGGTILGTVNRGNPLAEPVQTSDGEKVYAERCLEIFRRLEFDALVAIGGDGTLALSHDFYQMGMPIVGVPKTIDNDIVGTVNCFGFDTAVSFASHAIDRLHSTAAAHRRIMVVEVMGRYAGWIALQAGISGGADVVLIPEISYHLERIAEKIRERDQYGAKFTIVVVAEGAKEEGGEVSVVKRAEGQFVERLGGIGHRVALQLQELTGKEARATVLGHLQRGGTPTAFDRVLATRFGAKAVELMMRGDFGRMVASHPPDVVPVALSEVVGRTKTVPLTSDLIRTARAVGICFGD
ncbi:MAG: ATP-dependent 6-phosphofructokinase [Vicinamibacteraceae bacterium]|nr:ATP-dependent 6-phosphofructokinase [Vicinamibacteraceae bacterium]